MRFMLTDNVEGLTDALSAAGHEVVGGTDSHVASHVGPDTDHQDAYPLSRLLGANSPDVLWLVSPMRFLTTAGGTAWVFGCPRGVVNLWRGRNRTVVWHSADDPHTWDTYARKPPKSCISRPNDAHVYVTPDARVRGTAAGSRPSILWSPGQSIGPILAAIDFVRAGGIYRARTNDKWQ